MKKSLLILCIVIPSGVCTLSTASSQGLKRVGQSTMTFLSIDPVARSVGMGGVSTGMDGDVNALFHNPAGIARITGGAVSLSSTQWLIDMKQYGVALGYGFSNVGTFGASLVLMDNGEIPRTIPDASKQGYHQEGTFRVPQYAIGIGYARRITERFSIGGQIKYAYQDLGPTDITFQFGTQQYDTLRDVRNNQGVLAFDFGTIYYPGFKDLRIAMVVRNFSTKVRYAYDDYQLPVVLRFGLAMNVFALLPELEEHSLELGVEVAHPNDYADRVSVGGEYGFQNVFYLRGGYQFDVDDGKVSAGFGIAPAAFAVKFRLDYSYTQYSDAFVSVHRLSLGFSL